MVCWSLWKRRNKWVWDKANGSAFGVIAAASNLLRDWKEVQSLNNNSQNQTEVRRWEKPKDGWIKLNVDAAVFRNNNIGCGVVLRDAQGRFLGARCKRVEGAWRPREAEAIALKKALSWLVTLGYTTCEIETDSKILVQACSKTPDESFFGTIVDDRVQLLKHVNQVLLRFVFRSANSVAHELAKAAYSMSDTESGLSLLLISYLMY